MNLIAHVETAHSKRVNTAKAVTTKLENCGQKADYDHEPWTCAKCGYGMCAAFLAYKGLGNDECY
jgi:ribosomal protein L37E